MNEAFSNCLQAVKSIGQHIQ